MWQFQIYEDLIEYQPRISEVKLMGTFVPFLPYIFIFILF